MVKRVLGALHSAIQAGHSQTIRMSHSLQSVAKLLQFTKLLQKTWYLGRLCLSDKPILYDFDVNMCLCRVTKN